MSGYEFCPSPPRYVTAPLCVKCGATTMLTRIAPFAPGYNLQSFECVDCGNCDDVQVADHHATAVAEQPHFI